MIEVKHLTKELPLTKDQRKRSGTKDKVARVVDDVSFTCKPGRVFTLLGPNGAGKTTLIKLLTRLYEPSEGRITLDGLELGQWDPLELRKRVGVIFQDFARYQMLVGENVGAGDVEHFSDEPRWREAAALGMADEFVSDMPLGYRTQLGRWFKDGRELSGGQWQKIALSRAFMRSNADILVLDEPTAAMDAEAEALGFTRNYFFLSWVNTNASKPC